MSWFRIFCIFGFLALFLIISQADVNAKQSINARIVSKEFKVHLYSDPSKGGNAFVGWLENADKTGPVFLYKIKIEPSWEGSWDIILQKIGYGGVEPKNLFEPKGIWHGWWPFMLRARGLKKEEFLLKADGIICKVKVLDFNLNKVDPDDPLIDEIKLKLTFQNAK